MRKKKVILRRTNKFYKWFYKQALFSHEDHKKLTSDEMFAIMNFQGELTESFDKLIKALGGKPDNKEIRHDI